MWHIKLQVRRDSGGKYAPGKTHGLFLSTYLGSEQFYLQSHNYLYLSKVFFYSMCISIFFACMPTGVRRWHHILWNQSYLRLWATMWLLGTEPWVFGRVSNSLPHWAFWSQNCNNLKNVLLFHSVQPSGDEEERPSYLSHLSQQSFKLLQVQCGSTVGRTAVCSFPQPINGH